jgi:hypothetical protein
MAGPPANVEWPSTWGGSHSLHCLVCACNEAGHSDSERVPGSHYLPDRHFSRRSVREFLGESRKIIRICPLGKTERSEWRPQFTLPQMKRLIALSHDELSDGEERASKARSETSA